MTTPAPMHALVTGATGGIGRGICFALIEHAKRHGVPIRISAAALQTGRQLAREWASDGIRVNTVCPGMVRTPEDVGAAVAYLSSPFASYVTGQNSSSMAGFWITC